MPLLGLAAEMRIELMMPAKAAMTAVSMKRAILVRPTRTPRARGGLGLPPAAWIQLPNLDAVRT